MMKHTCSILEMVAAAVLLLATGCSKEEAPATSTSTERTTPAVASPANASAGAQPSAPATKQQEAPLTSASTQSVAVPVATAATAPANTNTTVQAPVPALRQPTAPPAAASPNATAAAPQIQPISLAQTVTNEARALAAAATNTVLGALATTNQVQALLEHAKALTANQKYQDALATLTELYNTKLTPEQKQKADELKAQIETAMTQKAASSLGNILGGQKK
jgi:hypothetical protein